MALIRFMTCHGYLRVTENHQEGGPRALKGTGMTNIYIKHANGEIMEVQNWETLTDYGAMITRPLDPAERQRYLALKAIRLRDSEIWRLFHPYSPQTRSSSAHASVSNKQPIEASDAVPSPEYSTISQRSFYPTDTRKSRLPHASSIEVQIPNPDKPNPQDRELSIEIGIQDLSKRALLHIIQKACSKDINALKAATHDELLALASAILPAKGVRVRVMPSRDPLASFI